MRGLFKYQPRLTKGLTWAMKHGTSPQLTRQAASWVYRLNPSGRCCDLCCSACACASLGKLLPISSLAGVKACDLQDLLLRDRNPKKRLVATGKLPALPVCVWLRRCDSNARFLGYEPRLGPLQSRRGVNYFKLYSAFKLTTQETSFTPVSFLSP